MRCPTLAELPPPPPDKTGWPWTEETPSLPETMPDGSPWPRISIVTPSYNQGQFIEETIRSVLLQGYPNLEYIIMDGGSTDNSVEIIKKYEPWLAYWVSEKDRGQSHAINKGFEKSTGEIMAWINSDDYYVSGAFTHVASIMHETETYWVAGRCYTIKLDGSLEHGRHKPEEKIESWFIDPLYSQPSVFWKRYLWENSNFINETLHCSFDYDLWMQFSKKQLFPLWSDEYFAYFRLHPGSKTISHPIEFSREDELIHKINYDRLSWVQRVNLYKLRQEKLSNLHLSKKYDGNSGIKKIFHYFFYAPWRIFEKRSCFLVKKFLLLRESK